MFDLMNFKSNVISDMYFCVDIETTGLEPHYRNDGILEIYIKIMRMINGGWVKIKEYYPQYYHEGWERTKNIHEIPFEELNGKPKFIQSPEDIALIKSLFKRCANPSDHMVFMAQYAPFEYKWFREYLFPNKIPEWYKNVKTFDTRHVAKQLWPEEPHGLIHMCEKFNVKFPDNQHDFHRADQDVNAMWELAIKFMDIIPKDEIVPYDANEYQFNFNELHQ